MSSYQDQLRLSLRRAKYLDEEDAVNALLTEPVCSPGDARAIEAVALALVKGAREPQRAKPLLDTFLTEYGLSNSEGVALMCLAESLLRIPDWDTADLLIAEKLGSADWEDHIGNTDSLLVNASTWALMLTGRIVELDEELTRQPVNWLKAFFSRISEPAVQAAVRSAMQILGREFVLGQTIEDALRNCTPESTYSFDMLGEAARERNTADRYFQGYLHAINQAGHATHSDKPTISIKLSALHPRYEAAQQLRIMTELLPRLVELSHRAAKAGLGLTVDAEEADRLDLSLDLFQALVEQHSVRNVGFVVQAYSKRAPALLDWLICLAEANDCLFPVRLVKGAYWDTEIKHAQVEGLPGFPVYTQKASTDLSYLVCAKKIFAHPRQLYGQFATHNAHTLAAVLKLGEGQTFEFQRLHGMGEILYATAREQLEHLPKVRTYAPVGAHEDLLAYLVRRLLENGANSSFVNRFLDEAVPPGELVNDPQEIVAGQDQHAHPAIRLPVDLFGDRKNSQGLDLSDSTVHRTLERAIAEQLSHLTQGRKKQHGRVITTPYDRRLIIGQVADTAADDIDDMVNQAARTAADWRLQDAAKRKDILLNCADKLEEARTVLMGLLVHEGGKTIPDALNEVREAVDFCRYYARQIDVHFSKATPLPGPTGEHNVLRLEGRGVWICISPWNFPLAIFLGQVSAALAAGNVVIAKPAEQTPLIAAYCLDILNTAGLPGMVCQLAYGSADVGQALIQHPLVAGVAFTGSTQTARHINTAMAKVNRPIAPLIAETGGQNAMIVDSTALLEQVTDDVVTSAFKSAGQRCSALRVLFLQNEIADKTINMLIGAMDELAIGHPGHMNTDIGPVISDRAAQTLQEHLDIMRANGWVRHQLSLTPLCLHGTFVAPTLVEIPDLAVLKGENFGPILHIIRFAADDIGQIVKQINSSGFGLTFGIHTRIDARAGRLADHINAGNVYVNRNMIGAVVGSQPFGGRGLSGTGPKAGGPNYLARFATEKVVTVNTVATGGNAELLNLAGDTK